MHVWLFELLLFVDIADRTLALVAGGLNVKAVTMTLFWPYNATVYYNRCLKCTFFVNYFQCTSFFPLKLLLILKRNRTRRTRLHLKSVNLKTLGTETTDYVTESFKLKKLLISGSTVKPLQAGMGWGRPHTFLALFLWILMKAKPHITYLKHCEIHSGSCYMPSFFSSLQWRRSCNPI